MATRKKILVVDDSLDILKLIRMILLREGFKVSLASNGQKALNKFDCSYDLVITDISMPEMNGCEFIECLETLKCESTKILITTASDLTGRMNLATTPPILYKPFAIENFTAKVYEMLGITTQHN